MDRHLLLLIAAILLPLYGFCAQTFTEGIFTYEVNENDPGTVTIIDIDCTENDDIVTLETVEWEGTEYVVTQFVIKANHLVKMRSLFLSEKIESFYTSYGVVYIYENIDVQKDNKFYKSIDGILYDYQGKQLLYYPCNRGRNGEADILINENVEYLELGAFQGMNIHNLYIPKSCWGIQPLAFTFCSIKKIIFSEGLDYICDYAFGETQIEENVILPLSLEHMGIFFTLSGNYHYKVLIKNADMIIYGDHDDSEYFLPPTYYVQPGAAADSIRSILGEEHLKLLPSKIGKIAYPDYSPTGLNPNGIKAWAKERFNFNGATGFQFDLTLPGTFHIAELYDTEGHENLQISYRKMTNGDYRIIGYTTDGSELGELELHFGFSAEDEEAETETSPAYTRGYIKVHDTILSVLGTEVTCDDFDMVFIQGYIVGDKFDNKWWITSVNGLSWLFAPTSKLYECNTYGITTKPFRGEAEIINDIDYSWSFNSGFIEYDKENSKFTASRPGNYIAYLSYTDPEIVKFTGSDAPIVLEYPFEILALNWGDADGNGSVNINDVAMLVNYILGDEPEGFNIKLADVDRNGRINVVDITETLKLVLSAVAPTDRAPQRRINAEFEADTDVLAATPDPNPNAFLIMTGEEVSSDEYRLSIRLDTDQTLVGIQTDLSIPEGMTIKSIKAGAAAADHILQSREIATGVTRVVLFSFSNSEITNGGNILEVTLSGSPVDKGVFNLTNTVGSTTDVKELFFNDSSFSMQTVGVYGISTEDADCEWYDLTGRRVMNPEKGVYIRVKNATSKKVIL